MSFLPWEKLKNSLKNRKKSDYIVVILIGVLMLVAAIPDGRKSASSSGKTEIQSANTGTEKTKSEDYISALERRLEKLLSQMEGVGKVTVMITLEDQGQVILDKDISRNSEKWEEKTIVFDTGNGKAPYVTQEKMPEICGVLVVAQGGGDAKIATDISEAVMALFGTDLHKIKVVEMAK